MKYDEKLGENLGVQFVENMPAAAFVCRVEGNRELLFANHKLVELFECESVEDFMEYTGSVFDGLVSQTQFRSIYKEVVLQVYEKKKTTGRLFYHIVTKNGNICLAEEHWTLVQDPEEGALFYCFMIPREYEVGGADYDPVTGLYGKTRFLTYANEFNKEMSGKTNEEYVVAYLNLVNFKLLNVNRGIDEGDACLKAIADVLSTVFEDAFLARLSDDHFAILDRRENLEKRMAASKASFSAKYENRFGVSGKWGFYPFTPNEEFDMEKAISYAKLACDSIKYISNVYIIEFTAQLAEKQNLSEHLARSVDEAISKGWVKVYYQPVIRAITGELCGVEALARWIDPEFGFIMPGDFISVLEGSRQIHKLDAFVVEEACRTIHDRVEKKLPVVPISVNFSRLDFAACDMLGIVEAAVEKYDVPRDYLHIEVTESMIASDEALMRSVIDSFRGAGYEIWMDDFGSGYSSLTVLKDYQFDMLKLDMKFLSSFTDKSRDIMRSAIIMAKDLGIKTLAEGVETKEHLEYLKRIGCDQIQGYYYGKPEPADDMFLHLLEKKIPVELRKWRHFFEVASFNVRATDIPLEVIEDDGVSFRTLFMNDAYKEQIGLQGIGLEEIDRRIYQTNSPLLEKYREFAEQMKRTGKPETFYYTKDEEYLCLRGRVIASQDGHSIIKATIINVAADQNLSQVERMDSKLRALNLLFKVILFADLKNQRLTPLLGTSPNMKTQEMVEGNVHANNAIFAENNVFPTERARYRAFMDFSTARERVEHSRFGYVTDVFRIKQPDGNYRLGEVSLMLIPGTDGNEFLYCVKPYFAVHDGPEGVSKLLHDGANLQGQEATHTLLWDNMLWNSSVKFFWKDRNRRFLGASQAFMDFFGFSSLEELVGKTDEELHWHIDDAPYREKEIAILQKGVRFLDEPEQFIVKGALHSVICYKMPIYENGLIVGIGGYFLDAEREIGKATQGLQRIKRDPVTQLMEAHAFADVLDDYAKQYHKEGKKYGLILARNAKYDRILETYGEEVANQVLAKMGAILKEKLGQSCVLARMQDSVFAVLMYLEEEQEAHEKAQLVQESLDELKTVKGNPITMRIQTVVRVCTGEQGADNSMYENAMTELMKEKAE